MSTKGFTLVPKAEPVPQPSPGQVIWSAVVALVSVIFSVVVCSALTAAGFKWVLKPLFLWAVAP